MTAVMDPPSGSRLNAGAGGRSAFRPAAPAMQAVTRVSLGSVNVYVLPLRRGVALVDTGTPGWLAGLQFHLHRLGRTLRDVRLVVLTHTHIDHVGNLPAVVAASGAPVIVHRSEADALAQGVVEMPQGVMPFSRCVEALVRPIARLVRLPGHPADVLVDDLLDLAPWGLAARLFHTPGHTRGSLTVVTDSGLAFCGDNVINQPFRPTLYPPLADVEAEVLPSWRRALAADPRWILPGHGPPVRADRLRAELARRSG